MSYIRILFKSWFLHPLSELIFILTGITLALTASVSWTLHEDAQAALDKSKSIRLAIFYIDPKIPRGEETKILNEIKASLDLKGNGLHELTLVNTDAFIEKLKDKYQKIAEELLQMDSEVERLIPRYISYTGPLSSGQLVSIQKTQGIEHVDFHDKEAAIWNRHLSKIQWITKWFSLVTFFCSFIWIFLIVQNEMKIHFSTQKHLRRLGAHPSLQLLPVFLSLALVFTCVSGIALTLKPKIENKAISLLLGDLRS